MRAARWFDPIQTPIGVQIKVDKTVTAWYPLAAPPPGVRIIARDELNVAELDVVDVAFVAQLNADAARTLLLGLRQTPELLDRQLWPRYCPAAFPDRWEFQPCPGCIEFQIRRR